MGRTTWYRRIATYAVTVTMAGFGLTGIASAQTITNTGPHSTNTITNTTTNTCTVRNTNTVNAYNFNRQTATSGNVTANGNTTVGAVSWAGWSAMDPATAQANGTSYASWWNGVVTWIAQRASGNGWNSSLNNLSWTPAGSSWSAYDPLTWQANGQSFGNWYNATEAYLNGNSAAWVLGWPAGNTGTAHFGSIMSGSATNNYNASFSININNAARAAAGTDSCGHSLFTPPPASGGMGGGGSVTNSVSYAPRASGGSGGGSGYGGYNTGYYPSGSHAASAPMAPVSLPQTGGMGGGGGTPVCPPATPSNTINNTGPGSTNTITNTTTNTSRVTNTNNVGTFNLNTQSASSGDTTANGNTTAGGAGTGSATNSDGTVGVVDVTN